MEVIREAGERFLEFCRYLRSLYPPPFGGQSVQLRQQRVPGPVS